MPFPSILFFRPNNICIIFFFTGQQLHIELTHRTRTHPLSLSWYHARGTYTNEHIHRDTNTQTHNTQHTRWTHTHISKGEHRTISTNIFISSDRIVTSLPRRDTNRCPYYTFIKNNINYNTSRVCRGLGVGEKSLLGKREKGVTLVAWTFRSNRLKNCASTFFFLLAIFARRYTYSD